MSWLSKIFRDEAAEKELKLLADLQRKVEESNRQILDAARAAKAESDRMNTQMAAHRAALKTAEAERRDMLAAVAASRAALAEAANSSFVPPVFCNETTSDVVAMKPLRLASRERPHA